MKIDVLDKGFVELTNFFGNDDIVVDSAKISFYKESTNDVESAKRILNLLISKGHTSPFEQVEFRFLVKCPIFVARQWMRHRTWSYNELSRRYSSDNIEYYIPEKLRFIKSSDSNPEKENRIVKSLKVQVESMVRYYELLLNNGVTKEHARMILPVNIYTTFYAKTDLRNLFHFLELRNASDAQEEIRLYAKAIEELIKPVVPLSYKIWKESLNE